jgi:hypothetical protein
MVCSICSQCGHNKRTCTFLIGVDTPTQSEFRVAKVLGDMLDDDYPTQSELRVSKVLGDMLDDDYPTQSELRVSKVLGDMLGNTKKLRKCGLCSDLGHNKRTCHLKCAPCLIWT